jgi:hypothetical protein
VLDAGHIPDGQTGMAEQELLRAERHAALRAAFTHLPPACQQCQSDQELAPSLSARVRPSRAWARAHEAAGTGRRVNPAIA